MFCYIFLNVTNFSIIIFIVIIVLFSAVTIIIILAGVYPFPYGYQTHHQIVRLEKGIMVTYKQNKLLNDPKFQSKTSNGLTDDPKYIITLQYQSLF